MRWPSKNQPCANAEPENATLERDQLIETREDIDVMEAELQERAGADSLVIQNIIRLPV